MEIANYNEASQQLIPAEIRLRLLGDITPARVHTALPDDSLDFFNPLKAWKGNL
jgi:hypothetical protein